MRRATDADDGRTEFNRVPLLLKSTSVAYLSKQTRMSFTQTGEALHSGPAQRKAQNYQHFLERLVAYQGSIYEASATTYFGNTVQMSGITGNWCALVTIQRDSQ